MTAAVVHWMIEERIWRAGASIPTGRIACRPLPPSAAWSTLLSKVTCTACREKYFLFNPSAAAAHPELITD